jgi:hypothetical protein
MVEAMVGPELAERRNLIQRQREALDALDAAAEPEASSKRAAPALAKTLELGANQHTHTSAPTDFTAVPPKRERRSRVALAIAVGTVLTAVAVIALQSGAHTGSSAAARAASAAPEFPRAPPTVEIPPPPEAEAVALARESAPTASAAASIRRHSVPAPGGARRTARPQHAPRTPQAAPFSSVNPYR